MELLKKIALSTLLLCLPVTTFTWFLASYYQTTIPANARMEGIVGALTTLIFLSGFFFAAFYHVVRALKTRKQTKPSLEL